MRDGCIRYVIHNGNILLVINYTRYIGVFRFIAIMLIYIMINVVQNTWDPCRVVEFIIYFPRKSRTKSAKSIANNIGTWTNLNIY